MVRKQRWPVGLLLSAGVATATGCARQATGAGSFWPPVLRAAARAVLVGRAYDRALKAASDENDTAMAAAYSELVALGATDKVPPAAIQAIADQAVLKGQQADLAAEKTSGLIRAQTQALAGRWYRQALRLRPQYDASNPELLNALGYYLADRGSTPADFREAERLTRSSVQRWDSLISDVEKSSSPALPWSNLLGQLPLLKAERAITRDSVAWALYREGRYAEAAREQEAALKEATANAPGDGSLGDLHFHLAEIYRALNRFPEARREYQEALRLKPSHAGAQRGLATLPAAPPPSATPVPIATPMPSATPPDAAATRV